MRNENEFNRFIGKELKRLSPRLFYYKTSDKMTLGVADFIVWSKGSSLVFESKYVPQWPSNDALLLKHPFSPEQKLFLENAALTSTKSFGFIGIEKEIFVVRHDQIPKNGNWKTSDFKALQYHRRDNLLYAGIIILEEFK